MKIRDFRFELNEDEIFTYGRNRFTTRILNSLSLLFPKGERFFVESLKAYEDKVDPKLIDEMKLFYRQEYQHAREHKKLNDIFRKHGLDVDALDEQILSRLNRYGYDKEHAMLVTVCLERLTGLMGIVLPAISKAVLKENEYGKLWLWHAMEEVEHVYVSELIYKKYLDIPKYVEIYFMFLAIKELIIQVYINYNELQKIEV